MNSILTNPNTAGTDIILGSVNISNNTNLYQSILNIPVLTGFNPILLATFDQDTAFIYLQISNTQELAADLIYNFTNCNFKLLITIYHVYIF